VYRILVNKEILRRNAAVTFNYTFKDFNILFETGVLIVPGFIYRNDQKTDYWAFAVNDQ